jgi:ParB-like chromosome segregation protein Spo0J
MSGIRFSFEQATVAIPLDQITATRKFNERLHTTSKYLAILSSIREVGIIEPLVVFPEKRTSSNDPPRYLLLDGHLRLEALKTIGAKTALCLISTDDEGFTYNRQVNRLSTIQEHMMIRRAIERGVSPHKLAAALNIDVRSIRDRQKLLEGIAPEVVSLLKDRMISRGVFGIFRKMKPMRQIEAAEMMLSANLFTKPYAEMLLAATRPEHLRDSDKQKIANSVSLEDIARMERELEKVSQDYKLAEDTLGEKMLTLVVAKGYVARLFRNKAINDYCKRNHEALTDELIEVIETVAAEARNVGRE